MEPAVSEFRRYASHISFTLGNTNQGSQPGVREREEIALECVRETGIRAIAGKLGRPQNTISREIKPKSVAVMTVAVFA
ncbi:helix-turn-helix domain-containing protein [Ochrobactrum soli]|uniref:helix-turn-helix domain-containing protein n=1 Tax=Ochrobactrum soli TaxID=2448455 RepID=UPI00353022F3